jgi:hypothetical protein
MDPTICTVTVDRSFLYNASLTDSETNRSCPAEPCHHYPALTRAHALTTDGWYASQFAACADSAACRQPPVGVSQGWEYCSITARTDRSQWAEAALLWLPIIGSDGC